MARFVIGSSLKMYFGHRRTVEWTRAVAAICAEHPATTGGTVEFFVIPTFPSIPAVAQIAGPAGIAVGAQDLHWADAGPFTGEVSGAELAELGCTMAEVGHAERRSLFGETDETVAAKTHAALRNGLAPVECIGEPEPGSPGRAADFCLRQLESALAPARAAGTGGRLIVAYEPVWAIGAPHPAPPEHVAQVCRALRRELAGDPLFPQAQVIYGGSAGPGLLPRIADDVDGMFLGRFAHDPQAVRTILDEVG
ncbi:triose-phosphate isomerase family protein [Nakamurella sp.]|uniref:triose-phosphate isomerase family protein n=1 Tax=Nakamurella sp. TaxID=1869182 RepID=UPI003B3AB0FF